MISAVRRTANSALDVNEIVTRAVGRPIDSGVVRSDHTTDKRRLVRRIDFQEKVGVSVSYIGAGADCILITRQPVDSIPILVVARVRGIEYGVVECQSARGTRIQDNRMGDAVVVRWRVGAAIVYIRQIPGLRRGGRRGCGSGSVRWSSRWASVGHME